MSVTSIVLKYIEENFNGENDVFMANDIVKAIQCKCSNTSISLGELKKKGKIFFVRKEGISFVYSKNKKYAPPIIEKQKVEPKVAPKIEPVNFDKTLSITGLKDTLYLTGSRYFGCVGNRSDCDYFIRDSEENRKFFIDRDFYNYTNELYIGDTQNVVIMRKWVLSNQNDFPINNLPYDIQFVKDVELKLKVQQAMFDFLETDEFHKSIFHATSRDKTYKTLSKFYWTLAFAMFNLEKETNSVLNINDEVFQKLFTNVYMDHTSNLTKNVWFRFASTMFEASKFV